MLCCACHLESNGVSCSNWPPYLLPSPAGRDKVEMLLAMGASRMEASREVVQRAARMALTPLLNTMNVVVRLLPLAVLAVGGWRSERLVWPSPRCSTQCIACRGAVVLLWRCCGGAANLTCGMPAWDAPASPVKRVATAARPARG